MGGWVKLHRQLLNKAIWTCSTNEQKSILITILLLANHEEKQWEWKGKKFICKPGQFVTSSSNLARKAGVTRQNVRTALEKLKNYEFLTYESTKTGTLITVVNWAKYQDDTRDTNQVANQQLTNDQPTANQQLTTNKKDKNDKKDIYSPAQLELIKKVVDYFNDTTGKSFSHKTAETRKLIGGRFSEGYGLEDMYDVIDLKTKEWLNDKAMSKYLCPTTIFRPSNFEKYFNQLND